MEIGGGRHAYIRKKGMGLLFLCLLFAVFRIVYGDGVAMEIFKSWFIFQFIDW